MKQESSAARHFLRSFLPRLAAVLLALAVALSVSNTATVAPAAAQYSWMQASQNPVPPGGTSVLTASVYDPDGDPITITWTATAGTLVPNTGPQVTLYVPADAPGTITVTATADDGQGGIASDSMTLLIVAANVGPFISITADPLVVRRGRTTVLTAQTNDPNGDPVTVFWFTTGGTLSASTGHQVTLTVPDYGDAVEVLAVADDGNGGQAGASLTLLLLPKNLPPVIRIDANPFVVRR